jgi:Fe-S cluster biosynthesis and repair protein YggX
MTPKEKAQELFDKILNEIDKTCDDYFTAKQCALIAVDEILEAVDNPDETYLMKDSVNYWTKVKQEIEAL